MAWWISVLKQIENFAQGESADNAKEKFLDFFKKYVSQKKV